MSKDYERTCIIKIKAKPFTSTTVLDICRLTIVLGEYVKKHDYIEGIVIIQDFRDASLVDILTNLNFIELGQFLTIITEGYGARIKGIHLVNQSKAVDVFFTAIKSVLANKIANRYYHHQDIKDLHKVIAKEILPVDYGGEERSIKELQGEWKKIISSEENEKYLEVMRASGTNESKRQTDIFNDQYMGTPGSFRTLNVD